MKNYFIAAALLGMIAVILGAFGAHGLKNYLDEYQQNIWSKAVFYQFVHVFALFVCVFAWRQSQAKAWKYAAIAFLTGITLFSGSLYLLALKDFHQLPTALIGPLTPVGGLFFLLGWIWLALGAWKQGE